MMLVSKFPRFVFRRAAQTGPRGGGVCREVDAARKQLVLCGFGALE
jgi:hypothetical protein